VEEVAEALVRELESQAGTEGFPPGEIEPQP
jgi:hypothetical protein